MAKPWAKSFYNSKAWRECRKQILHRDHYTCVYCCNRAEEVHHKIELSPKNIHDITISLNSDNLISLCGDCHKKETKGNAGDIPSGFVFDDCGNVVRV